MQEVVEEAFGGRRPEMFVEKLGGYLPEGFDMASCRSTQLWVAFMFQCRTFLVEVTREAPLDVFTPNEYRTRDGHGGAGLGGGRNDPRRAGAGVGQGHGSGPRAGGRHHTHRGKR